jgi:ketosteroid isomerase-like protein
MEEIVIVGDAASTRSRIDVSAIPNAGGEAKHMTGYTLTVFRKQADVRWVLARDANLLTPKK